MAEARFPPSPLGSETGPTECRRPPNASVTSGVGAPHGLPSQRTQALNREAPSHRQPCRTESPAPAGIRAPPRGPWRRIAECPGKYNCPVSAIGLPWIHDLSPGAEAARIHESGAAAFGCPGRRSGCLVSASRHLPASAPGESPSGAVSFTSSRIDRPGKLSSRKPSRTDWIIDMSIA